MAKPKQKGIVSGPEDEFVPAPSGNGATNSAPELEIVPDQPLSEKVLAVLERQAADPSCAFHVPSLEAALLTLRPAAGTQLLVVRICEPNQGWRPTVRYDNRQHGSFKFISARQFLGAVTAPMIGAAEAAHGRAFPYCDPRASAEYEAVKVEIAGAVFVVPGSERRQLYVRHNGVWAHVTDWSRHTRRLAKEIAAEAAAERRRRQNSPDVAIV